MLLLVLGLTMAPLCVPAQIQPATRSPKGSSKMLPAIHPDSVPLPAELQARLEEALVAKGSDYVPRTRHKDAQGKPRFTNRLILSTSPYLLQHAHNPVDWRPWGPEALAEAQALGRPIFLSVGYSTCHWCHVMEEESFEDPEIAALMNSLYVPIKVDREERPDVDNLYMTAVHLMRRRGGWPMSVWADPQGRPFFVGTYFPPDGKRGVRQGFQSLLKQLAARYQQDPESVHRSAQEISEHIKEAMAPQPAGGLLGAEALEGGLAWLRNRYDVEWGGVGDAPKFPSSVPHRLILRLHRRSANERDLKQVILTLDKMAAGGMNDQLGGGFHRYSTDREWLVPHFEKMLYDNALLVRDYLAAYQVTGREDFAETARRTLDYLLKEMRDPSGGFWSATDADSEGEEGTFFVWKDTEFDSLLSAQDARLVKTLWGLTPQGNFEHGTNILHLPEPLETAASGLLVENSEVLKNARERARKILYDYRSKRIPPGLDDKLMADWNGLTLSALAAGAFVLDDAHYRKAAVELGDFILNKLRAKDGRLIHSRKAGRVQAQAFLEDYAFTISGLLDLLRVDPQPRWLEAAMALQKQQDDDFLDRKNGAYFLTANDQPIHIAREKPDYDGAIPSGNSYALHNLLRLAELTGEERYAQEAERAFKGLSRALARGAMSHGLAAVERRLDVPREIVVIHPDGGQANAPLMTAIRKSFQPNAEILEFADSKALKAMQDLVPWVQDKYAQGGKTTVYVCERGVCHRPALDLTTLSEQLALVEPLVPAP